MKLPSRSPAIVVLAVLFALCTTGAAALGEEAAMQPSPATAADRRIRGRWTGAKLRCQKEENKLVRCGTPLPFEITFTEAGTGTTSDENLPKEFSWRWTAPQEISLGPKDGGQEIKLFGVEHDADSFLTFQAYVYLPPADPNSPAEVRYIHYVFDVTRAE